MPSKSSNKQKKETFFLVLLCGTLVILFLSAFNLSLLSTSDEKVLAKTTEFNEIHYWKDFLSDEPEYLPGWIRLVDLSRESADYEVYFGALTKIGEIDPNIDLGNYSFFSSD